MLLKVPKEVGCLFKIQSFTLFKYLSQGEIIIRDLVVLEHYVMGYLRVSPLSNCYDKIKQRFRAVYQFSLWISFTIFLKPNETQKLICPVFSLYMSVGEVFPPNLICNSKHFSVCVAQFSKSPEWAEVIWNSIPKAIYMYLHIQYLICK